MQMRVNVIMKKLSHGKITMMQAGEITKWMMWAAAHEVADREVYELQITPYDTGGLEVHIHVPDDGRYKWFGGSFVHQSGKELEIKPI